MVSVPPRIAQNPMGISRRDSAMPVRVEMRLTTGRNRAAAPTFCMKLEIMATVADTMGTTRFSLLPPSFNMYAAKRVINPVRSRPAPSTMTAIMEMTALLAKPSNRWFGGTILVKPRTSMMRIAATSTRTISNTNK
jgi:hypothetical protein